MSHNFVSNHSTVRYQELIFCPKCGYVCWHENDSPRQRSERQNKLPPRCSDDSVTSGELKLSPQSPDTTPALEDEAKGKDT